MFRAARRKVCAVSKYSLLSISPPRSVSSKCLWVGFGCCEFGLCRTPDALARCILQKDEKSDGPPLGSLSRSFHAIDTTADNGYRYRPGHFDRRQLTSSYHVELACSKRLRETAFRTHRRARLMYETKDSVETTRGSALTKRHSFASLQQARGVAA